MSVLSSREVEAVPVEDLDALAESDGEEDRFAAAVRTASALATEAKGGGIGSQQLATLISASPSLESAADQLRGLVGEDSLAETRVGAGRSSLHLSLASEEASARSATSAQSPEPDTERLARISELTEAGLDLASAQRVLELEKQEARLRTELQGLTSRIVATEPGSVEERADLPATDDSDCAHVLALVQDFLDGELPGDQRALVTTHLESCGHCLEVYDVEAELAITIRKIGDRVHSSALRERLRRVEAALAQPWTEA